MNENHLAKASKDRTGLFMNKPEFIITSETGKIILDWCNSGIESEIKSIPMEFPPQIQQRVSTEEEVYKAIQGCNSIAELLTLYKQFPNIIRL